MGTEILSSEYRISFVDDLKYDGRVANHLSGLAAAIEDSHETWRPTVSELLSLLPESDSTNALVASGMAYGSAKSIEIDFPGPAILLYGAALNVIGSSPNTALSNSILIAEEKLITEGLGEDPDIRIMLHAAKERASFDKVSQMLRDEFRHGLLDSGFDEETVSEVVPKIVSATHDVRHKGLIERLYWTHRTEDYGGSSTDAAYLHQIEEVEFKDDILRSLLSYAAIGCSFSILRRIKDRRYQKSSS
jgi:hypothetical protein